MIVSSTVTVELVSVFPNPSAIWTDGFQRSSTHLAPVMPIFPKESVWHLWTKQPVSLGNLSAGQI